MTKYTPQEIPEQIDATIYTHYCINGYSYGELKNYDYDCSGENYVCVAKTPLTIAIPPVGDLKDKVVKALEEEKKKQMAEHHKKMFELQEKIDSLICLEYKPLTQDMDTANELPF